MNWDQFAGKWKQTKGSAREQWGKLTDDDIDRISGKRDELIGQLQRRYGIAKEAAEKQADEWWTKVSAATTEALKPAPAAHN